MEFGKLPVIAILMIQNSRPPCFAMRDLYHDLASIQGSLAIDRRRDCAELPTPEDVSRLLPVCSDPQGTIPLMMLNCELQLAQVYRAVSFGGRSVGLARNLPQ